MHFTYTIQPEKRAILLRYEGDFTLAELFACSRKLWDDPAYSDDYDGIVDLSTASLGFGIGDLRVFIDFMKTEPRVSHGRWAAVTTSPLVTACSLLYQQALSSRHTFEVFSTWAAACAFLHQDLESESLPAI